MLNSNDSAKVVERLAADLIRQEKRDILNSMSDDSRVAFVNGVQTLNVICAEIEKNIKPGGDIFLMHTGDS